MTWFLSVELGDDVVRPHSYVDFLHAFWSRRKVGVDGVLDGVEHRLERRVAVELPLVTGEIDVSRVPRVHGGGTVADGCGLVGGTYGQFMHTF